VGGLVYVGATIAAGAVVVSSRTILAAVVAATLAGGASGVIGAIMAKGRGDKHAHYLQAQIDHGGLLWVRTRDTKAEERAAEILKRHSLRDVHVHTLSLEAAQAQWRLTEPRLPRRLHPLKA
jgi:hypothetical protein